MDVVPCNFPDWRRPFFIFLLCVASEREYREKIKRREGRAKKFGLANTCATEPPDKRFGLKQFWSHLVFT